MGIKLIRALPNSPQTGGRFEAFVGRIKMLIRGALAEHPNLHLDEAIDQALSVYKYGFIPVTFRL